MFPLGFPQVFCQEAEYYPGGVLQDLAQDGMDEYINSFSDEFSHVPGGQYVRAQYEMLLGNTQRSEQLLKHLQQSWALKWLPRKDPFWHAYPLETSDKQHLAGG